MATVLEVGAGKGDAFKQKLPIHEHYCHDLQLLTEPIETLTSSRELELSLLKKLKEGLSRVLSVHPTLRMSHDKFHKIVNNESLLRRWLQGKERGIQSVLDKLVCSLEWREANDVDGILALNLLGELQYTFPVYFGSVDNANRPVVYVPLNRWNLENIPLLERSGDYFRFVISFLEKIMNLLDQEKNQGTSQKFSMIIDVQGLSTTKMLRPSLFRKLSLFSRILELYYPPTLLRCIVINCASHMDQEIFKLNAKPFLWRKWKTPSVFHFHMHNSNWIEVLRSIIPSEELLVEYGGWKQLPEDVVDNLSLSESQL